MNAIARKRCTPLKVFLGFSLLNLALFLLLIPFLGQKGFDWVVFSLAVLVQAFLTDDIHAFWDFSCWDSVSSLRRFSCI